MIIPLDSDGDPVKTTGSPILSFNWSDPEISGLALVEGVPPESADQFVMDVDSADRNDFVVGEHVRHRRHLGAGSHSSWSG